MRATTRLLGLASVTAVLCGSGCLNTDKAKSLDARSGIVPPVLGAESPSKASTADLTADESARLALDMATGLEKAGNDADAVVYYEKARHADPALEDRCRRRLAVLYDRLDQPAKASAEFEAMLRSTPDDPDLLNDVGYSYYNRGRWSDAEGYLRKSTVAAPDHKRAWVNLGLAVAQQGRLEEAYAAFVRAGTPADAHTNVAFVLATQGKRDDARAAYRRALDLEPAHERATAGLAVLDAPPSADAAK